MTSRNKRGRPPRAAQSLDEALQRHYAGKSPARARNDFERAVMGLGRNGKRGGGRALNPNSPTRLAAQLAAYLVQSEGITVREATRRAATAYGVHPDSFRRMAADMLKGPQVQVRAAVSAMDRQLVGGAEVVVCTKPLLVSVESVEG